MRRRPLLATLGTLSTGLGGCIGATPSTPTTPSTWVNVPAPETRPEDSTPADMTALVRGNAGFALDLVDELVKEEPSANTMISPVSLGTAMGMVWAGAAGQTATEIREVMRYLDEQTATHRTIGALLYDLANIDLNDIEGSFELSIANAFWGQEGEGTEYHEEYLDLIDSFYGSEFHYVDFLETAAARERINGWATEQTNDRIDDLLPEGFPWPETKAMLTNAVYLLADWEYPFDPERTRELEFTNLDGSTSTTDMMIQQGNFRWIHGEPAMLDGDDQPSETTDEDGPSGANPDERFSLLELPYVAESIDMVLILPPEGRFETFEAAITGEWLIDRFDELAASSPGRVAVTLPRFTFENDFMLGQALVGLGMVTPFRFGQADFSNMIVGGRGFFIHEVFHDTFVSVDELGTEAAAATAVEIGDVSAPPSISFDRPFLFAIRDQGTNALLFYGRVVDGSSLEPDGSTE